MKVKDDNHTFIAICITALLSRLQIYIILGHNDAEIKGYTLEYIVLKGAQHDIWQLIFSFTAWQVHVAQLQSTSTR